MIYKLFKYSYKYYVQGTEEHDIEYALLHVHKNASFNNNRSTLINERHNSNHEIDIESVEDMSI